MGAGASSGTAGDLIAASDDDVKAALTALPPDALAKLQTSIGGADVIAQEFLKLTSKVTELSTQVNGLQARLARQGLRFSVAQYNILAGYLGNNTEPWFLYGVDMPAERRAEICAKHVERGPDGKYCNVGWPNYVRGILSDEEIAKVEEVNASDFNWEARKVRVLAQIAELDADVLSLVECDDYKEFFEAELTKLGYDSSWAKRPRPNSADGCCIAWKRHMFVLDKPAAIEEYVDKYDPATGKTYKDRIALLNLLRFIGTEQKVCVVSTHLTRNPEDPKMDALRAKQIGQVLRKITEFTVEHGCVHDTPVVLAGDLNATSFQKLRGIANAVTLLLGPENAGTLHPFAFDCKELPTGKTSVTAARDVRIDALLYQSQRLVLTDSRKAPALPTPIPDQIHPSDHIPIMATFEVRSALSHHQECARAWFNTIAGRTGHVPLTHEGLASAYFVFEVDSDDLVSRSEFLTCVSQALGFDTLSDADVDASFERAVDKDKGGITFASFVKAYCEQLSAAGLPGLEDLRDAFKSFDKDGGGTLSYDEVEGVFTHCSPVALPEGTDVTAIVKRIDTDGDGHISIDEFLDGLTAAWVKSAGGGGVVPK